MGLGPIFKENLGVKKENYDFVFRISRYIPLVKQHDKENGREGL